MDRQHYGRRSPSLSTTNFFNDADAKQTPASPPPRRSFQSYYEHHHDNILYSPSRSSTNSAAGNVYSLHPPPTPDSPWTLSPHRTPSPSLLYHCIAALHRHDGVIFSVVAAKGLIFTGSDSSRVRAWRQPDCSERGHLKARHGGVRAILAHGNTLFTSHKDYKIRTWTVTSGGGTENFQAKKPPPS